MTTAEIVLIVVGAFLGGSINAIAGGGSLVVFPALLATGMTPLQANVTNSVALWPGYLGGVVGFRPELAGQRDRVRQVVVAAVLGSAVGCALLLMLPSSAFDAIVPVLVLMAAVLLYFQPRLKAYAAARQAAKPGARWELPVAVGLGAVYGGYFGGALGVILLGVLALVSPDTLRRNNALKAVISLVSCSVTVVVFGLFGPVHWGAVALAAPTALIGGVVGARLARRIRDDVLRWVVIVLSVGVAGYLIWRAFVA